MNGNGWDRGGGDRAQTPQDFAFGVSILLVTVIVVFILIQGSLLTAYDSAIEGDTQEAAERVASYLVVEFAVDGTENTLRYNRSDGTGFNETMHAYDSDGNGLRELKNATGLNVSTDRRVNPHLNVTLVNSTAVRNGSRRPARSRSGYSLAWGEAYSDASQAASVVRVVSLELRPGDPDDDGRDKCPSGCWLVVRVW